jgi:NitT/TauT family transport system substrate-binding protein
MSPRTRALSAAALAAAAALTLAGCSGSGSGAAAAGGSATPTVTVGVFAGNLIPVEVAEAKGYFADAGVKVQFKTLAAGPAIAAAAESGSVDIGYGDTLAWAAAVGNGFTDLDLVQAGSQASPDLGSDEHILVSGTSGITSPKQLEGKKVGIIPYPEFNVATKLWIKAAGGDPSTVKFVTIQDGTQAALLAGGDVDAVEGRNLVEDQTLVQENGAVDLGYVFGPIPDKAVNTAYFAKKSWLSANKSAAQKVVDAIRKGADYVNTAPSSALAPIAEKYAGMDFTSLEKKYPGITDKTDWGRQPAPVFDAAAVAATNEWVKDAVEQGQIKKAFDIKPYLWSTASASGN